MRTALGASRSRVIAQLVTESVLLAVAGAGLGLLIALWSMNMIKGGMPPEIERFILGWKDIQLNGRALLYTLAAALLTGILVAAEVALAVVLLVGAGLMVRGFRTLVDNGERLEPQTLLTMRLAVTHNKYEQPHQVLGFYREVLDRIRVIPGVRSATAVTALPYAGHSNWRNFTIEGLPVDPGNVPNGMYQVASPSYFETLHVPLRAGRLLSESDGPDAPKVALISERMAQRWWPNQSPLGKRIRLGRPGSPDPGPWLTIAGVVGDMAYNPYDRQPRRVIYVPYQQAPVLFMDIGVRTAGDPLRAAPAVTAAIRSVDREQPITDMRTMAKAIHNNAIGLNYMAVLMGVFGALALGAARQNVLGMVFRRGMTTVAAGLGVGLPLAWAFARLMSSLVFGVTASDPATFVGIPLALVAAAALAIYVPARRAMLIDPIVALRYE